jgi:hypothetical protein
MNNPSFDSNEPTFSAQIGRLEAVSYAPVRDEYRRRGSVAASVERLSQRLGRELDVYWYLRQPCSRLKDLRIKGSSDFTAGRNELWDRVQGTQAVDF